MKRFRFAVHYFNLTLIRWSH